MGWGVSLESAITRKIGMKSDLVFVKILNSISELLFVCINSIPTKFSLVRRRFKFISLHPGVPGYCVYMGKVCPAWPGSRLLQPGSRSSGTSRSPYERNCKNNSKSLTSRDPGIPGSYKQTLRVELWTIFNITVYAQVFQILGYKRNKMNCIQDCKSLFNNSSVALLKKKHPGRFRKFDASHVFARFISDLRSVSPFGSYDSGSCCIF